MRLFAPVLLLACASTPVPPPASRSPQAATVQAQAAETEAAKAPEDPATTLRRLFSAESGGPDATTLRALGGATEVAATLEGMARDPKEDPTVRSRATTALGLLELPPDALATRLSALANDAALDGAVRRSAIHALGKVDASGAETTLRTLSSSTDPELSGAAKAALRRREKKGALHPDGR